MNGTPRGGFPPCGVHPLRDAAGQRAFGGAVASLRSVTDPDLQGIPDFALHPDAELLCGFDHPHTHLRRWKGLLTAKAWLGRDLACFFAGQADDGGRIVVLLQGGNCFCPRLGGADMRGAVIGALYELDVFVPHGQTPIVDRAERIAVFA